MALFPGGTGEQSSASEGAQGHSPARRAGRALDKGGIWPTHWAGVVTVQCLSEEEMSEPLIHDHQPASMLQGSFSAVSEVSICLFVLVLPPLGVRGQLMWFVRPFSVTYRSIVASVLSPMPQRTRCPHYAIDDQSSETTSGVFPSTPLPDHPQLFAFGFSALDRKRYPHFFHFGVL
jgi:hypothetical protein